MSRDGDNWFGRSQLPCDVAHEPVLIANRMPAARVVARGAFPEAGAWPHWRSRRLTMAPANGTRDGTCRARKNISALCQYFTVITPGC